MDEIHGYIEKITFQSDESGFTIAQLKKPGASQPTCLVGSMPALKPGETVRCWGKWTKHPVYGQQFAVERYSVEAPADVIGIRKYLGSGLIKGIGPIYAKRIVDAFGKDTLAIIDTYPDRLSEIPGIGRKRIDLIRACWEEQKVVRDVMVFLQSHGVSPAYAQKIYKIYGSQCINKVRENPYNLAKDVFGIGFKSADAIASRLGIAKESPQRIEAGIEYVLTELSSDGHVCYPVDEFVKAAEGILESDPALITQQIDSLVLQNRVEVMELMSEGARRPFIWSKFLFLAELGIAREMERLKTHTSHLRKVDVSKALEWVQSKLEIKLAEHQQQAVSLALSEKVLIITGGPGTGKSTITKAILAISDKLTSQILLAAPTGRAAKRMAEITGREAKTIHSLLEVDFQKGGFKRGKENPLECDLLIIDEASMIDTPLMYSLLKAIPSHARLLLVGDIDQLPSVGPGNILKDMIGSQCLPVVQLTEIFRQAAGSRIITNAHMINKGLFPDISVHSDSDFFFIEAEEPEEVLKHIVVLVTQRLPRKYHFDPIRQIQVLAPMRRGSIGTENLNVVLQEALNAREDALTRFGRKYLEGDKVMQIRNDYKREVFNGDVGVINTIDHENQELSVRFDERDVAYDFSDLDDLVLAYAVSIHKYQGSECPCVVIPVHTAHFKLLTRNLLYTGVTRGKRLVILVGTKKALSIAVRNDEVKKRYTGLQPALLSSATQLSPALAQHLY
ncbi:MAG: ATP-dependent RecD-like DNA helicase [Parachlamydia sp.]|nr:ATP-dependent RecD-like DNA helicase [Parachlamydia sp.]